MGIEKIANYILPLIPHWVIEKWVLKRYKVGEIGFGLGGLNFNMLNSRVIAPQDGEQCEQAMILKCIDILKGTGVGDFIDIGASYGFYSMLASNILPPGRIHSFEPSLVPYTILRANNKRYCNGEMRLNRLFVGERDGNQTTTLDSYWGNQARGIKLIKMDIEGWECQAIKGMEWILKNLKPYLLIEFHERKMRELFGYSDARIKGILRFIEGCGYKLYFNGHHWHTYSHNGVPSDKWVETPPNNVNYAILGVSQ